MVRIEERHLGHQLLLAGDGGGHLARCRDGLLLPRLLLGRSTSSPSGGEPGGAGAGPAVPRLRLGQGAGRGPDSRRIDTPRADGHGAGAFRPAALKAFTVGRSELLADDEAKFVDLGADYY